MAVQAPSRRPRVSQAFVDMHRRRRYVDATAEILHEFGRAAATTTNVINLAGGARSSFYEVFSNVEECITYGLGIAEAELFASLEDLPGEDGWLGDVERAIAGFFEAVAANPTLAELYLIHSATSRTEQGRGAFDSAGEHFLPLLRRGRAEAEALGRRPPSEVIEQCLSHAIVALAAARVRRTDIKTLAAESRPTAAMVAGFYVGGTAQV